MGCQHTTQLHSTTHSCNKRFRVYAKTMDTTGLITASQKQPATSSVCLALSQNHAVGFYRAPHHVACLDILSEPYGV